MRITSFIPVNASSWQSFSDVSCRYFYTGALTSFDKSCVNIYRPFAWLQYNTKNGELTGARDHFGQEPFYYCIEDNKFIFGSSIPDIIKNLRKIPEITDYCEMDIFSPTEIKDPPFSRETYYKGIYRVTPGNLIRLSAGEVNEDSYWMIATGNDYLQYKSEADYYDEFSYLLNSSVKYLTNGYSEIALEFSGGLDSTSILIACNSIGICPKLFSNKLPKNWINIDEEFNIELALKTFNNRDNHQYVNSDEFEPLDVFKECAEIFAGPPPYWLGMLNIPIPKNVAMHNIPLLLSGFAGDECFSLRCPFVYGLNERIKLLGVSYSAKEFILRINQDSLNRKIFNTFLFIAHTSNGMHKLFSKMSYALSFFDDRFLSYNEFPFFSSLRDYQYSVLQGPLSHELRMKIEYDAIIAKKYKIKYAYPLLYPPLIEFCINLPPHILHSQGQMAILARKYIQSVLPSFLHNTKTGPFVASAADKCRKYMNNGLFNEHFQDLPFAEVFEKLPDTDDKLFMYIRAYMLKYYLSNCQSKKD